MQGCPSLRRVLASGVLATIMAVSAPWLQAQESGNPLTVSEGKLISLEYTLKLETDQAVLESNVGGKPLIYRHGSQQIIPGLEKALTGLKVGETRAVVVPPGDGYGEVDPQAMQEVKKELVPPDAQKVGARLQGKLPDGRPVFPMVAEVKEATVVLDFNHPLAGKTLHFDVKVVDIQQGQEKTAPAEQPALPR
ncbi:MAG: peptidylprolyl isomerase [Candidatus Tectimicrobiota bacterium]